MFTDFFLFFYFFILRINRNLSYNVYIMDFKIHNYENIHKNNVLIGQPFKYNQTNYYNLYFNSSKNNKKLIKEKIIIQTPILFLSQSLFKLNGKSFLSLSFLNEVNDKDNQNFKLWLKELENDILKKMKKKEIKIKKKNLARLIKFDNFTNSDKIFIPINIEYTKCIQTKNNIYPDAHVLDWNIKTPTYVNAILWIRNVWHKNDKWGLNIFCYLIRVMPSHIVEPLDYIKNDNPYDILMDMIPLKIPNNNNINNTKNPINNEEIETYSRYIKMLKMGIPLEAVIQKIKLADLNPETFKLVKNYKNNNNTNTINSKSNNLNSINNRNINTLNTHISNINLSNGNNKHLSSSSSSIVLNTLHNQILNNNNNNNNININNLPSKSNFLTELKSKNYKLNKVSLEEINNRSSKKTKDDNNFVPSLDEILKKLNTLNKTKQSIV